MCVSCGNIPEAAHPPPASDAIHVNAFTFYCCTASVGGSATYIEREDWEAGGRNTASLLCDLGSCVFLSLLSCKLLESRILD